MIDQGWLDTFQKQPFFDHHFWILYPGARTFCQSPNMFCNPCKRPWICVGGQLRPSSKPDHKNLHFSHLVVVLLLFPKFDRQFDPLSSTLWSCFAILNEFSLSKWKLVILKALIMCSHCKLYMKILEIPDHGPVSIIISSVMC